MGVTGRETGMHVHAQGGRIMFHVSTHRHVRPRAHKGVGHGVDELSAHSEITQLDLTAGVHQDIWGLDVWKKRRIQGILNTVAEEQTRSRQEPRCTLCCLPRPFHQYHRTCKSVFTSIMRYDIWQHSVNATQQKNTDRLNQTDWPLCMILCFSLR